MEQKDKPNGLKRWFAAFIPRFVSNKVIVWAYEIMRFFHKILRKDYSHHYEENRQAFEKRFDVLMKTDGFIEDQNRYEDMHYGITKMRGTGCEIIATYNALRSILGGTAVNLADLILDFEKDGIALSGRAGSAPKAIRSYFEKHGFETGFATKLAKANILADTYESLILTMYNDKDNIMKQVHTINISKCSQGLLAHNVWGNGKVAGPYSSFQEMMNQMNDGQSKMICLIGINRRFKERK